MHSVMFMKHVHGQNAWLGAMEESDTFFKDGATFRVPGCEFEQTS